MFFLPPFSRKNTVVIFINHTYVVLYSVKVRYSVFYTGMILLCVYNDHMWKYIDVFPYKALRRRFLRNITTAIYFKKLFWQCIECRPVMMKLCWIGPFSVWLLWDFFPNLLNLSDDLSLFVIKFVIKIRSRLYYSIYWRFL